jgi:glyoxylase-like metal-dependent hydrolase (beta-lactamase superfamily II)
MEEILPGIYRWSWFSEEKKYDFNGYVIISGQETVIIDPPSTAPEDFEWLRQLKSVFCILLTNRDHVRESESFRKKLSSRILIHEKDAPLIDIKADGTFRDQDRLPGGLVAVHVPDNKSPGETALFLGRDRGVMFLGDALIGNPPGQLNLMPADKYANVEKAREGIRVLLNYQFESVLAGDGSPILAGGKQAVQEFLEKR